MKLELITDGLKSLLIENNYSPITIRFYEREWDRLREFLLKEYGETEFEMERGLLYLEKQYSFISKVNDDTLSQQRVQLLRIIHMIEDYSLHQSLTRRYHASKNPIQLNDYYSDVKNNFFAYMNNTELSDVTKGHYIRTSEIFMDYLTQIKVTSISSVDMNVCNGFIKTLAGYSYKTIEQKICGLRFLIRYLYSEGIIGTDYSSKIHMPAISKTAKIPSVWSVQELREMLSVIDRSSPIGKRDYAMIVLACVLGLRIGDIKLLKFSNFNWEEKKLSIVQHKTKKPLTLPIPDEVGWAVIDYIKNGRPSYYETDIIFLKHMPPFDPIGDDNHMYQIITKYMRKAGINRTERHRHGFHSLRHSAGSILLEMDTPLPVITNILGHSDPDITAVYLKTDLQKLRECVLMPEDFCNE